MGKGAVYTDRGIKFVAINHVSKSVGSPLEQKKSEMNDKAQLALTRNSTSIYSGLLLASGRDNSRPYP